MNLDPVRQGLILPILYKLKELSTKHFFGVSTCN
jgi:hypothetical protein